MAKDEKAVPEWVRRESRVLDRLYAAPTKSEKSISTTISQEYKSQAPWYSDHGELNGTSSKDDSAQGFYKRR